MSTNYTITNAVEDRNLYVHDKVRLTIDVKLETAIELIKLAEEKDKPKPFNPNVYTVNHNEIMRHIDDTVLRKARY